MPPMVRGRAEIRSFQMTCERYQLPRRIPD
jgi:hypothetical protein